MPTLLAILDLANKWDFSLNDLRTMLLVAEEPRGTTELAKLLNVSKSTACQIIKQLTTRKLLRKIRDNKQDERRIVVTILPHGQKVLENIRTATP